MTTYIKDKTYRTACGDAGIIVEFDDSVELIRAYCGSDSIKCDGCSEKASCELWEYDEIRATHCVCGWEEADELLNGWIEKYGGAND